MLSLVLNGGMTSTINYSLKDTKAANFKAEHGESRCDSKDLHVHNVKWERREGNKEDTPETLFSYPYKIRLEL